MPNDITIAPSTVLAVAVPRSLRLRLEALRLKRGQRSQRSPTIKELVVEALGLLLEGRKPTQTAGRRRV